jgi:quercetin dioxygenase-like cupin family protein
MKRIKMEFICNEEIVCLQKPGIISKQLIYPENSISKRITITNVILQPNAIQNRHSHNTSEQIWIAIKGKGILLLDNNEEKEINTGDVVRFEENDVHGLRNNSNEVFEYISVTSPPIDFTYAYNKK